MVSMISSSASPSRFIMVAALCDGKAIGDEDLAELRQYLDDLADS